MSHRANAHDQAMVDAIRAMLGLQPLYADPAPHCVPTIERMLNSDSFGVGWTDGNRQHRPAAGGVLQGLRS